MSTLRLVIAWLVMAALPLQGLAAASMLFCDQAAHSATSQPAGGHDHAAHGHSADGGDATHAHDGHSSAKVEQFDKQGTDEGHACPICASCCNLVALPQFPALGLERASHASQPLQGPSRVITRHAPAPDKPPRA